MAAVRKEIKSSKADTGVASHQTELPSERQLAQASGWTFFSNHAHVIILLTQDPSLVLREVAARIGITERAVQRIASDLEENGFVERKKVGRRNQYKVMTQQRLRHPIESHRTIGDLLEMVLGK